MAHSDPRFLHAACSLYSVATRYTFDGDTQRAGLFDMASTPESQAVSRAAAGSRASRTTALGPFPGGPAGSADADVDDTAESAPSHIYAPAPPAGTPLQQQQAAQNAHLAAGVQAHGSSDSDAQGQQEQQASSPAAAKQAQGQQSESPQASTTPPGAYLVGDSCTNLGTVAMHEAGPGCMISWQLQHASTDVKIPCPHRCVSSAACRGWKAAQVQRYV